MYIKTQKFLILGASKSGFAVAKYLVERGANCKIYEELKTPKVEKALEKIKELGLSNLTREQALNSLKEIDILVISPGVPINHELAVKAKQLNKRIMGELEFAYSTFNPPIIAVTGTNGKTTTVTLIDAILERAQKSRQLVGNVGIPMTEKLSEITNDTVLVTEVSSFQLESVNSFCPHVSCVLNIAPDHLERHYGMENYVFLKKRIFKNQRESEFTVLNFDDQTVKNFYPEVKSNVVWVSIKGKVEGAYRREGKLYYYDEYIMDEETLKLQGEHNVYNALFAIVSAKLLGISNEYIVGALKDFKGVKHRIEFITEKNGVEFYNDSKATNTASTIGAIETMKRPTVLILGGSEKGENYGALFDKIKLSAVKHVVITGASKYNMLSVASEKNFAEVTLTDSFEFSIKIASLIAQNGDAVLFSPACASFDKFASFEERGEAFVKAVGEL